MNPGILTVYRWELRKLRAQKRTYLGLGAAAIVPIIFVVALVTQTATAPTTSPSAATSTTPGWRSRWCCCSSARSGCSR